MKRILAVDTYLIEATQEAYLWLWDWTAVYVATLMFLAYVGDHVCWRALTWLDSAFIAFAGIWIGYRYVAQSKDLRRLNAAQRAWRDFPPRPFFVFIFVGLLAGDILQLNAWHFASDVFMLIWNYLGCVQVREREPKEFFAHKLARAGA